jgi:hypothetical protein
MPVLSRSTSGSGKSNGRSNPDAIHHLPNSFVRSVGTQMIRVLDLHDEKRHDTLNAIMVASLLSYLASFRLGELIYLFVNYPRMSRSAATRPKPEIMYNNDQAELWSAIWPALDLPWVSIDNRTHTVDHTAFLLHRRQSNTANALTVGP